MSGYVISEEDFGALENTRDMAELLATGMGCTADSAEVVYPQQVASTARCLARLIEQVLKHAHFDMQATTAEEAADA